MKNKRAIKTVVVEPSAQFRMLRPFLTLLFIHVGGLLVLNMNFQSLIAQFNERQNDELTAAMMRLNEQVVHVSIYSMILFMAVMIYLWIRYTHRIFGPMIPINRQITKLVEGDYTGEINLRKADEFRDTATKLNQLTEALKKKLGDS